MRNTSKIKSLSRLKKIVDVRRRSGEKIVFTNGCFDLLHRGHIELLSRARQLGDCLIVGINSDKSLRRLKGPGRPLQSQSDRAHILAALEAVDYVVIFEEDTPQNLIHELKPDILVKGADYPRDKIVGAKEVKRVQRIPLVSGRSTSGLIKKIVQAYGKQRTEKILASN